MLTAAFGGALSDVGVLVTGTAQGTVTEIGTKLIVVSEDLSEALSPNDTIVITAGAGTGGVYTVVTAEYITDHTDITVVEDVGGVMMGSGLDRTLAALVTDDVDANDKALTQGTLTALASLTDLVIGVGSLTMTGDFACPDVQEVRITCAVNDGFGGPVLLSFGTSGVDSGCQYSGTGYAVSCAAPGILSISGDLTNSGSGYGVHNDGGTITDFSGVLTNSGNWYGVYNAGTWTDFSGVLTNSGSGDGAYNDGTWTDFSGTLVNSGAGEGASNAGTWLEISGSIGHLAVGTFGLVSATGIIALNEATITRNDGTVTTNSVTGVVGQYIGGVANNAGLVELCIVGTAFGGTNTGTVQIATQADLLAANILTGKVILGVAGEVVAGGIPAMLIL